MTVGLGSYARRARIIYFVDGLVLVDLQNCGCCLPALSGDAWLMAFGGSFLSKVATLVGVLPSLAWVWTRRTMVFVGAAPQLVFES